MMPKGVDHCSACLTPRKTQVQKSLMPKGVDHQRLGRLGKGGKIVQKSLMPKGVDHTKKRTRKRGTRKVQKSLMPKGVDHRLSAMSQLPRPKGRSLFTTPAPRPEL